MKNQTQVEEIRIRMGQPLSVRVGENLYYVTQSGSLIRKKEFAYQVSRQEVEITFEKLSQYSLYACQEQLREGYITLEGGHRAGICGSVIYDARGIMKLSKITSVNLRVAHRMKLEIGQMMPYLTEENRFLSTLIISPPGCGKTTLLRELITYLSEDQEGWRGINISVADERSEIGNRMGGVEGFDLGPRTDILDHCKKSEGMLLLLRSMSPDVIAADELGGSDDIRAVEYIRYCGCSLLLTIHGNSLEDVLKRPELGEYLTKYPFHRYLILSGRKTEFRNLEILDHSGTRLWQGELKGCV